MHFGKRGRSREYEIILWIPLILYAYGCILYTFVSKASPKRIFLLDDKTMTANIFPQLLACHILFHILDFWSWLESWSVVITLFKLISLGLLFPIRNILSQYVGNEPLLKHVLEFTNQVCMCLNRRPLTRVFPFPNKMKFWRVLSKITYLYTIVWG